MNGYLLDTNIALDVLDAPDQLSAEVRDAVARGPVFLSVLSYWEVAIKSAKGKLVVGAPREWWYKTITDLDANVLLLRPEHVSVVADLPPIHQDPFDRALIAQATVEDLVLITSDRTIPQYGIKVLA